jgi:hypothetical protein
MAVVPMSFVIGGHAIHDDEDVDLVLSVYVPFGHCLHWRNPDKSPYVPKGHGIGVVFLPDGQ